MTYRRKNPVRRHSHSTTGVPFAMNPNNANVRSVMLGYALCYLSESWLSVQNCYDMIRNDIYQINSAPCAAAGPTATMGTILQTPSYSTFLRLVRTVETKMCSQEKMRAYASQQATAEAR